MLVKATPSAPVSGVVLSDAREWKQECRVGLEMVQWRDGSRAGLAAVEAVMFRSGTVAAGGDELGRGADWQVGMPRAQTNSHSTKYKRTGLGP
jgi:hypothetical protein